MPRFDDYMGSKAPNFYLVNRIKEWWLKRGYVVRPRIEKVPNPQGTGSIYVVRLDIPQNVKDAENGHSVG
jgi:hypothetical protein